VAFDPSPLRAALRRDMAARAFPQFGGEPLWANLSAEGRQQLGRLIDWLSHNRPDVYTAFADEDDLLVALADAAEQMDDVGWTIDDLLKQAVTDAVGVWLVSVPLVGVAPPDEVWALDEGVLLAPASTWRNDNVDPHRVRQEVARLAGAPAEIGSRYLHDVKDELIDTRRTATLVCKIRGTRGWCRRVAFEQCRFLVAGWTLFSPPESEMYTPMWPLVTEWQPQPQLHVQEAAHHVAGDGAATKHRGMTIVHGPDDDVLWPWPDEATIKKVLRAVRAAGRSRAAAALITAAWDLYLAARNPSDAPWIERLVHIMHAREALCEDPSGDDRKLESRFRTACGRLGIADALQPRGWGQREMQIVSGELRRLRNLAAHSSDISRLRLGYPPIRERPKLESDRVAEIYVREAASPAFHAMRELCVRLWTEMDPRDYAGDAFEATFS
jgi:hypothetical protein